MTTHASTLQANPYPSNKHEAQEKTLTRLTIAHHVTTFRLFLRAKKDDEKGWSMTWVAATLCTFSHDRTLIA